MLTITITVENEALNFRQVITAQTFDMATEGLGTLERNYEKRVAMELTEDNHE